MQRDGLGHRMCSAMGMVEAAWDRRKNAAANGLGGPVSSLGYDCGHRP